MTALQLPRDLGGLQFGPVGETQLDTQHGRVRVEASGFAVRLGPVHAVWSRPRRATVERANGVVEAVPVQDGVGRVVLTLAIVGAIVTLISLALSRR